MPPPPPPRRLDGGHTATHPSKIHTTECHIRGELVHESHWSRKQMLQLDVNAFSLSLSSCTNARSCCSIRGKISRLMIRININVLAWSVENSWKKNFSPRLIASRDQIDWSRTNWSHCSIFIPFFFYFSFVTTLTESRNWHRWNLSCLNRTKRGVF